jgi:hypothetical protein
MSFLQEADSSLAPSVTAESTTSQSYKKGRKTAPVWEHTRAPLEHEDQDLWYCSYCDINDITYKPYGADRSSAMNKHIKSKHPHITVEKSVSKNQEAVREQLRQLYRQAESSGDTEGFNLEVLESCLNMPAFIEALVALIVVRNLSYRMVEWTEFQVLCQVLNKACKGKVPTAHSTVSEYVKEAWIRHKDVVRTVVQAAISHIHISLDIWTSPNQWLLLAICAHFTSYEQKKEKALLALKKVPGHSGEDQFSILVPVLQDYGIEKKLGAIIADNAPPNSVLCRIVENHMKKTYDREWLADEWRIRCIGHIINLVVQAFLFAEVMDLEELASYDLENEDGELTDEEAKRARFRLLGPLGKGHNIVVHIGGSPARTDVFRKLAGRLIPMDNRTRWNSWYEMLLVLLLLKGKVEDYCEKYESELEEDLLSREDWKKLGMIKDFLAPFSRATLATEGDGVSIDLTLFNMDILIQHLQETTVRRSPSLLLLANLHIIG